MKSSSVSKDSAYQRKKDRERARNARISLGGRDIAPLREVVDPVRKSSCEHDFRLFCDHYFPETFVLPFCKDHLAVIGQIQESVLRGGLFATAMPRGSGKTSLCERACIWAILYGHREFVVLIGASERHASDMMDSIKTEIEANPILLDDFPEAVEPVHRIEGIAHRCRGQLYNGEQTRIGWTADEIIFPTILGSRASGAVIRVRGITGGFRGMKFTKFDGRAIRPSLVIVDDPQTDESARSPAQCEARERILAGAVLGLAGPGQKISGIMPCTVIACGDMADNILDRSRHPEWNGTRTKMVYDFPTNNDLWNKYAELRRDTALALAGERKKAEANATAFYAANREAMDAGATVAWPERFEPDELSGLQSAMNIKIDREYAFHAEYQGQPLLGTETRDDDMTPDQIAGKVNRRVKGEIPLGCSQVTAFVDVQASVLYYAVCAWEDSFTGHVVDYGSFPDQHDPYFALGTLKRTLSRAFPGKGLEGQLYAGLEGLVNPLMSRDWKREDGAVLRIERCLIDHGWGVSDPVVFRFCRQSTYLSALTPSKGMGLGASSTPMAEWSRKPGDKVGLNWKMPNVQGRREVRRVVFDANYWKSFLHARLSTAMGDSGCLALFGDDPKKHRMLADHITSEYRVRTQGRGRDLDEWKQRPDRPDNHFFDCLVGCAVAASIQGISLNEARRDGPAKPRKRVNFADLQRAARANRA